MKQRDSAVDYIDGDGREDRFAALYLLNSARDHVDMDESAVAIVEAALLVVKAAYDETEAPQPPSGTLDQ